MIVALAVGHMFKNIDQTHDANRDANFFLHFTMQSGQYPFPMLNLAAGHDPQAVKGVDTPTGKENPIVLIDDTGND